jgi:hypothetical protein
MPERLREPPRPAVVGDLRVDHQRLAAWTREPFAHREEVFGRPDRHPRAAEAAADRGEVGVGEPDRVQVGVAEVVDLRAVRRVVVDDHHQRQAEPDRGVHFGQCHVEPAVAGAQHRQPVRAGERRADRRAQAQPDALERLREAEPLFVGHREVGARVAHEVAGVDRDDPFRGQQFVEQPAQRPRVDPAASGEVLVLDVVPAAGRDPGGDLLGAVALLLLRHGQDVDGGARDISDDPQVDRPVRAERALLDVDLDELRVRAEQLPVPGRPHVQRAAPADDEVGPDDQLGGQG